MVVFYELFPQGSRGSRDQAFALEGQFASRKSLDSQLIACLPLCVEEIF